MQGEELGGDGEEEVIDENVGGVADDFDDVGPGEQGAELVEFQVDAGGVGVELAGVGEGDEFVELGFAGEAFGAPEVGHEGEGGVGGAGAVGGEGGREGVRESK